MRRLLLIFVLFNAFVLNSQDKGVFSFRDSLMQNYETFRGSTISAYEQFRDKVNNDYVTFLKSAWGNYSSLVADPHPRDAIRPVTPIVYDGVTPIRENPKIEVVPDFMPERSPKPSPQVPIDTRPLLTEYKIVNFTLYNTLFKVKYPADLFIDDCTFDNNTIAEKWHKIANSGIEQTILDLLVIRDSYKLCDWMYLHLLYALASQLYESNHNAKILLFAYLYGHSGYKMRIGRAYNKIYLLYSSEHYIYDVPYYYVDNTRLYPFDCKETKLDICPASLPGEQSMSLIVESEPLLMQQKSTNRTLTSSKGVEVNSVINSSLLDFYSGYPSSSINDNPISCWAIVANAPLSTIAKNAIYPTLKAKIANCSVYDQVNLLLNFVQTAFRYKKDSEEWGRERAFFADEVLIYPYCDCEDRTVLFTRLVRDLLGLNCAIVYYPGHLAAAVEFPEELGVSGDRVILQNREFVICDPTYINSSVGMSMPGLDRTQVRAMILAD